MKQRPYVMKTLFAIIAGTVTVGCLIGHVTNSDAVTVGFLGAFLAECFIALMLGALWLCDWGAADERKRKRVKR